MTEKKLNESLDKLRDEIRNISADDPEAREKLDKLIINIESGLNQQEDAEVPEHGLVDYVKEAINDFETSHPRATAILNDIMVTLSNMGI